VVDGDGLRSTCSLPFHITLPYSPFEAALRRPQYPQSSFTLKRRSLRKHTQGVQQTQAVQHQLQLILNYGMAFDPVQATLLLIISSQSPNHLVMDS
jgi:hypothetical protein